MDSIDEKNLANVSISLSKIYKTLNMRDRSEEVLLNALNVLNTSSGRRQLLLDEMRVRASLADNYFQQQRHKDASQQATAALSLYSEHDITGVCGN